MLKVIRAGVTSLDLELRLLLRVYSVPVVVSDMVCIIGGSRPTSTCTNDS